MGNAALVVVNVPKHDFALPKIVEFYGVSRLGTGVLGTDVVGPTAGGSVSSVPRASQPRCP